MRGRSGNGPSVPRSLRSVARNVASSTSSTRSLATAIGVRERNQTVLLRLELKTLGEADLRQNVSSSTTADGIASVR